LGAMDSGLEGGASPAARPGSAQWETSVEGTGSARRAARGPPGSGMTTGPLEITELRRTLAAGVWLIGAAYLAAALVGLPLFGDGAYYYFKLAADHDLLLPNLRYAALLPQLPGWLAVHWISDALLLRHVFSMAYQSLPWLSLAACWLLVRRRAPWLMLWPLLAALANLINFSAVSELLAALYLCWPLTLAMALSPERRWVWGFALLAGPWLLALHPMAFVPAVMLAAAAGLLAWQRPDLARVWRRLSVWLALCGALRLGWTAAGVNAYERGNLSAAGISHYLMPATPAQELLVGLALTAGLVAAWIAWRRSRGRGAAVAGVLLPALLLLLLGSALAVALEVLAGHGIKLKAALVFVAGLGLMALAFVLIRLVGPARLASLQPAPAGARPLRWLIAALLVLILAKSAAWWTATRQLQDVLAGATVDCIAFGPQTPFGLQWPWMQIIDDWATPMSALAFRPRLPDLGQGSAVDGIETIPLLLPGDGCARLTRTGEAHLTSWLWRRWELLEARFGPLRRPQSG